MNGYILSVIGTVLVCAILTAIAPEGKTSGIIKASAKLVCLLAIVAPIIKWSYSQKYDGNGQEIFFETVIDTDEDFIKYYSELRIRSAEQEISQELQSKYAVETEVTLSWDMVKETQDLKITGMRVQTKNSPDREVVEAMWEYLTMQYCSEVLIE